MTEGQGVSLGYRSIFGLRDEAVYGAGLATTTSISGTSYFEATTFSPVIEIEELKSEEMNTSRAYTRRFQMNRSVSGSIEKYLNPEDGIKLLWHSIGGNIVSTGTAATGFTHTITPNETNQVTASGTTTSSLSLLGRKGTTDGKVYKGARVDGCTISGEIGSPITASYEIIGQDIGSVTALTDTAVSFSTARPFLFKDAKLQYAASVSALTSTAEIKITNFEIGIANNIDADQRAMGQDTVVDLPAGRRDVTLGLTMRYDTTTAYDRFINGLDGAARLVIESAELTGNTSTASPFTLEFTMPKVYWNNADPEISEEGAVTISPELTCIQGDTTATAYDISVKLINDTEAY